MQSISIFVIIVCSSNLRLVSKLMPFHFEYDMNLLWMIFYVYFVVFLRDTKPVRLNNGTDLYIQINKCYNIHVIGKYLYIMLQ